MSSPDPAASRRVRAEVLLISITVVWGSTFVLTKGLLSSFSPFLYVAVRFCVAALLFAIAFPSSRAKWSPRLLLHGGFLGVLLFAGFALQTIGLETTTASKSAFITGMLVVCTPLWQVILERRLPRAGSIAGVVLVIVGLYLLTSPDGGGFTAGDGMTLVAAILFGLYIVILDIVGTEEVATRLTLAQFVVSGGLGIVVTAVAEDARVHVDLGSLGILAYLVVFATIIALYVQTRYQKDSTPTRAAVIFSLEPVLAAGFAYLIADEILAPLGMIGGGLIVLGVLVSELSDKFVLRSKPA